MNRVLKIILLLLLTTLLLLIRYFEDSLYYDPLISFFKSDYTTKGLPQFNGLKLLGNVVLRFLMNTSISLTILWLLFKELSIIKLSSILYTILFIFLIIGFYYLLFYSESKNYLPLFYVRRFLIQPLFLLILIPAFYFQRKNGSR